ncbi:helix-turn-helix domain-containing protein [Inquilinus sp. Marseille-Q2685]|uniref:helix-turn-helix domain-containing protein n=1 Tax=Inquilinus sp. Marseille-Q2685 TaxID=2866581 RepID=UPI001CE481F8|nr:helix-turn-helix domain-containing protein [Inquilinus sp. Marseille-Q2685]
MPPRIDRYGGVFSPEIGIATRPRQTDFASAVQRVRATLPGLPLRDATVSLIGTAARYDLVQEPDKEMSRYNWDEVRRALADELRETVKGKTDDSGKLNLKPEDQAKLQLVNAWAAGTDRLAQASREALTDVDTEMRHEQLGRTIDQIEDTLAKVRSTVSDHSLLHKGWDFVTGGGAGDDFEGFLQGRLDALNELRRKDEASPMSQQAYAAEMKAAMGDFESEFQRHADDFQDSEETWNTIDEVSRVVVATTVGIAATAISMNPALGFAAGASIGFAVGTSVGATMGAVIGTGATFLTYEAIDGASDLGATLDGKDMYADSHSSLLGLGIDAFGGGGDGMGVSGDHIKATLKDTSIDAISSISTGGATATGTKISEALAGRFTQKAVTGEVIRQPTLWQRGLSTSAGGMGGQVINGSGQIASDATRLAFDNKLFTAEGGDLLLKSLAREGINLGTAAISGFGAGMIPIHKAVPAVAAADDAVPAATTRTAAGTADDLVDDAADDLAGLADDATTAGTGTATMVDDVVTASANATSDAAATSTTAATGTGSSATTSAAGTADDAAAGSTEATAGTSRGGSSGTGAPAPSVQRLSVPGLVAQLGNDLTTNLGGAELTARITEHRSMNTGEMVAAALGAVPGTAMNLAVRPKMPEAPSVRQGTMPASALATDPRSSLTLRDPLADPGATAAPRPGTTGEAEAPGSPAATARTATGADPDAPPVAPAQPRPGAGRAPEPSGRTAPLGAEDGPVPASREVPPAAARPSAGTPVEIRVTRLLDDGRAVTATGRTVSAHDLVIQHDRAVQSWQDAHIVLDVEEAGPHAAAFARKLADAAGVDVLHAPAGRTGPDQPLQRVAPAAATTSARTVQVSDGRAFLLEGDGNPTEIDIAQHLGRRVDAGPGLTAFALYDKVVAFPRDAGDGPDVLPGTARAADGAAAPARPADAAAAAAARSAGLPVLAAGQRAAVFERPAVIFDSDAVALRDLVTPAGGRQVMLNDAGLNATSLASIRQIREVLAGRPIDPATGRPIPVERFSLVVMRDGRIALVDTADPRVSGRSNTSRFGVEMLDDLERGIRAKLAREAETGGRSLDAIDPVSRDDGRRGRDPRRDQPEEEQADDGVVTPVDFRRAAARTAAPAELDMALAAPPPIRGDGDPVPAGHGADEPAGAAARLSPAEIERNRQDAAAIFERIAPQSLRMPEMTIADLADQCARSPELMRLIRFADRHQVRLINAAHPDLAVLGHDQKFTIASYTRRLELIALDPSVLRDLLKDFPGGEALFIPEMTRNFAHELAHAEYERRPPSPRDFESLEAFTEPYVRAQLTDEGHSRLTEYIVSDELDRNGGLLPPKVERHSADRAVFARYKAGELTREEAAHEMGELFRNQPRDVSGKTYGETFAEHAATVWNQADRGDPSPMAEPQAAREDGGASAPAPQRYRLVMQGDSQAEDRIPIGRGDVALHGEADARALMAALKDGRLAADGDLYIYKFHNRWQEPDTTAPATLSTAQLRDWAHVPRGTGDALVSGRIRAGERWFLGDPEARPRPVLVVSRDSPAQVEAAGGFRGVDWAPRADTPASRPAPLPEPELRFGRGAPPTREQEAAAAALMPAIQAQLAERAARPKPRDLSAAGRDPDAPVPPGDDPAARIPPALRGRQSEPPPAEPVDPLAPALAAIARARTLMDESGASSADRSIVDAYAQYLEARGAADPYGVEQIRLDMNRLVEGWEGYRQAAAEQQARGGTGGDATAREALLQGPASRAQRASLIAEYPDLMAGPEPAPHAAPTLAAAEPGVPRRQAFLIDRDPQRGPQGAVDVPPGLQPHDVLPVALGGQRIFAQDIDGGLIPEAALAQEIAAAPFHRPDGARLTLGELADDPAAPLPRILLVMDEAEAPATGGLTPYAQSLADALATRLNRDDIRVAVRSDGPDGLVEYAPRPAEQRVPSIEVRRADIAWNGQQLHGVPRGAFAVEAQVVDGMIIGDLYQQGGRDIRYTPEEFAAHLQARGDYRRGQPVALLAGDGHAVAEPLAAALGAPVISTKGRLPGGPGLANERTWSRGDDRKAAAWTITDPGLAAPGQPAAPRPTGPEPRNEARAREPDLEAASPRVTFHPDFGDKLLALRLRRGLTQEQLAERTGLSSSAIGKYERGEAKPRADAVHALLKTLQVAPEELGITLPHATAHAAFGPKLAALRTGRGWSQTRLAEEAGVSKATIVHYENGGEPSRAQARKLADALGVELQDLGLHVPDWHAQAALGSRIKALREEHGLSQAELADRAGVSRSAVRDVETEARSGDETLAKIAEALGVTAAELRGDAAHRPRPAETAPESPLRPFDQADAIGTASRILDAVAAERRQAGPDAQPVLPPELERFLRMPGILNMIGRDPTLLNDLIGATRRGYRIEIGGIGARTNRAARTITIGEDLLGGVDTLRYLAHELRHANDDGGPRPPTPGEVLRTMSDSPEPVRAAFAAALGVDPSDLMALARAYFVRKAVDHHMSGEGEAVLAEFDFAQGVRRSFAAEGIPVDPVPRMGGAYAEIHARQADDPLDRQAARDQIGLHYREEEGSSGRGTYQDRLTAWANDQWDRFVEASDRDVPGSGGGRAADEPELEAASPPPGGTPPTPPAGGSSPPPLRLTDLKTKKGPPTGGDARSLERLEAGIIEEFARTGPLEDQLAAEGVDGAYHPSAHWREVAELSPDLLGVMADAGAAARDTGRRDNATLTVQTTKMAAGNRGLFGNDIDHSGATGYTGMNVPKSRRAWPGRVPRQMADEFRALYAADPEKAARVDPQIRFDPTDPRGARRLKDLTLENPGVFAAVGAELMRGPLTTLLGRKGFRFRNAAQREALMASIRQAQEIGYPVFLRSNAGEVKLGHDGRPQETTAAYDRQFDGLKALLREVAAGGKRVVVNDLCLDVYVRPDLTPEPLPGGGITVPRHVARMEELLQLVPDLKLTIGEHSAHAIARSPELRAALVDFVERHPGSVLFESGMAMPLNPGMYNRTATTMLPFVADLARRDPDLGWAFIRGNYEALIDAGRTSIDRWTWSNLTYAEARPARELVQDLQRHQAAASAAARTAYDAWAAGLPPAPPASRTATTAVPRPDPPKPTDLTAEDKHRVGTGTGWGSHTRRDVAAVAVRVVATLGVAAGTAVTVATLVPSRILAVASGMATAMRALVGQRRTLTQQFNRLSWWRMTVDGQVGEKNFAINVDRMVRVARDAGVDPADIRQVLWEAGQARADIAHLQHSSRLTDAQKTDAIKARMRQFEHAVTRALGIGSFSLDPIDVRTARGRRFSLADAGTNLVNMMSVVASPFKGTVDAIASHATSLFGRSGGIIQNVIGFFSGRRNANLVDRNTGLRIPLKLGGTWLTPTAAGALGVRDGTAAVEAALRGSYGEAAFDGVRFVSDALLTWFAARAAHNDSRVLLRFSRPIEIRKENLQLTVSWLALAAGGIAVLTPIVSLAFEGDDPDKQPITPRSPRPSTTTSPPAPTTSQAPTSQAPATPPASPTTASPATTPSSPSIAPTTAAPTRTLRPPSPTIPVPTRTLRPPSTPISGGGPTP